ncbi:MAG: DUF1738 domain-containing protein [Alteromonadaceae bacterium]|nr:DUF1738 domain-containing protein [Alteromonadaceae bacterium]
MKTEKREQLQRDVTNSIIETIEEGGLLPWQCPWQSSGSQGLPFNQSTKEKYNGINILLLWGTASKRGYQSQAWLTFKQAQSLGGKVRKGEKSVRCLYYKPLLKTETNANTGEEKEITIPMMKPFSVFNVEQIDGIELSDVGVNSPIKASFFDIDIVKNAENLVNRYATEVGLVIEKSGGVPSYNLLADRITIPNVSFDSPPDYASTLFHECIHSTGHKRRTGRIDKFNDLFKNSKKAYAMEELVAACGEAFMCAEFGYWGKHLQHETYINSFLKALKNDHTFIFKAAKAASKAVNFILENALKQIVVSDDT